MAVSYIKLWKLLLDKRLKRVDLKELAGISSSTLAKLGRDEYLSMESMEKICKALNADIGDIMEFTNEAEKIETDRGAL